MIRDEGPDRGLAVVTGGTSGIGRACAGRLADEGYTVASLDITATSDDAGTDGVVHHRLDVTDEHGWREIVTKLRSHALPVDVLVCSAGVLRFGTIEDSTLEDFRLVQEVNLVGTFLALRAVLPIMRTQQRGSAIAISSVAGLMPKPNQLAYVASKWGVRGMVKAAAQDMSGTGVRVNSVHPGPVQTEMTRGLPDDVFVRQPLRRRALPDEVASVVSFLANESASYCTGSEFVVDGGHVLQG